MMTITLLPQRVELKETRLVGWYAVPLFPLQSEYLHCEEAAQSLFKHGE